MKCFFKKAVAMILSIVAILSGCAFSATACEMESVDSIPVDTIGSETDISPQSIQYGHLEGTYSENGCSVTFRVKVALRDDPDYVSGFTIIAVEKESITAVEKTGWMYLDEYTLDTYTIGRTGQTATLRVSFVAAKSDAIRHDYPNREVTISLR